MAPAAAAKGLSLVSQPVAVEPDSLLGDPTRIRQLLVNLLANAVNFTSAGEVTVSVSGRPAGVGRFQLFLSVSDTGPGIPREQQARLFEPFSQPDGPAGRASSGTGLGLTLCSRLCQLMGGTISVVSQPGRGSVFTASIELGLPLPRGQGPADGRRGDRRNLRSGQAIGLLPDPDVPMAQRAPLRILLAEGKGTSRKVALGLLARLGYRADTADNGQAALDAVARTSYDVVLMEVQMPGIDGLTATRQLRRRFGAQPRVIAVAKGALAADVTLCLEAGMDDYLTKPIDAIELAAALERAVVHLPPGDGGR
jgi:CheY-like chemotaxis protein